MMSPLLRFAVLHFSTGMVIGVAIAAVLFFSGTGVLARANTLDDRLLAFFILATTLGGYLGIACLATALHFAAEDD